MQLLSRLIMCGVHYCVLYCAAFNIGDYSVQRTLLVIVLCIVH